MTNYLEWEYPPLWRSPGEARRFDRELPWQAPGRSGKLALMSRSPRVAVIGAGSWGTTVASLTAANAPTVIWARDPDLAEEIGSSHANDRYLPGAELDPRLEATHSLAEAAAAADVLVLALPSHGFRTVLELRRVPAAECSASASRSDSGSPTRTYTWP